MDTHRSRTLRRTDLFLVRMWTADARDGDRRAEWHGRVQRAVDGEAHQFDGWQNLVDLLLTMLSEGQRTVDDGAGSRQDGKDRAAEAQEDDENE